jgi:hypothetical protein
LFTDYPDYSNNYDEHDFEEGNVKYEKTEEDRERQGERQQPNDIPPNEADREHNGRGNYEYEVQDY